MKTAADYNLIIERGQHPINDRNHDFIVPRIRGRWLDIGCNSGWLLEDVPHGVGVDASPVLVEKARAKGLDVRQAWAEDLPFADRSFDTAVLSTVLQMCADWKAVLQEAKRVAARVIGIAPYPGTEWGVVGGTRRWVRSVVDPHELAALGATITQLDDDLYFFEAIS